MAAMFAVAPGGRRLARRAAATLATGLVLGSSGVASSASAQTDAWPMAGGDAAHAASAGGPPPPYAVAWRTAIGMGGPAAGPVLDGGTLVVVASRGIVALDAGTGAVRWQQARSAGSPSMPAIVDGLAVHAAGEGEDTVLVARRLDDGAVEWETPMTVSVTAPVTAAGDLVLAGTEGGGLRALDSASGEERWSLDLRGAIEAAPAVAAGVAVVTAFDSSAAEGVVAAVRLSGPGAHGPLWRTTFPGRPGAPSMAGDAVHLVTGQGRVVALDLETGDERWSDVGRDLAGPRQVPAARADLLVVADATHVSGRDPTPGEERWNHPLVDRRPLPTARAETLLSSSPAVVGEAVVVGGAGGRLVALRASDGHRVWTTSLGDAPLSAVAAAGDHMYVATIGPRGEVVALGHDPGGRLVDVPSPTTLFPLRALTAFAIAALLTAAAILALFALLVRIRRGRATPA